MLATTSAFIEDVHDSSDEDCWGNALSDIATFINECATFRKVCCISMQDNIAYIGDKQPRHLNDEQIKRVVDYGRKLEAYGIYLYENAMQVSVQQQIPLFAFSKPLCPPIETITSHQ